MKLTLGSLGARLLSFDNLLAIDRLSPHTFPRDVAVTPTGDFYVQSVGKAPKVRKKAWRLAVEGMINRPRILTFDEIYERPRLNRMVTLACIGNQPGGHQIGNAVWTGCSLKDLMLECGLHSSASRLIFECEDIFFSSSTIDRLFDADALLVYAMNGRPLSIDHGFPLRLILPGRYGMKSPKWIRRIIAGDAEHRGYWENFGWSDQADIQLTTRIDDRMVDHKLTGIALNGNIPISRVDVSLDDGRSWSEATLRQPNSSCVWSEWSFDMDNVKGDITVVCRATNAAGLVQDPEASNPYPDGASAPDRQRFRIM